LFVLMHRGSRWTQLDEGTEVWVFDASSHQRVQRVRLSKSASALAVTRDDAPLLFTTNGSARLSTYRAVGKRFEHVGDLDMGTDVGLLSVPER
ncbi:MAG: amine dehydrogenase large subunit, partial [Steroidobacteraceae bacterium]